MVKEYLLRTAGFLNSTMMMMKKIFAVCLLTLGFVSKSQALTLGESLTPISGFTTGVSLDGPNYNPFVAFSSIVSFGVFQATSFTGGNNGSQLLFEALGGAGAYDGHHGIGLNSLGYFSGSSNNYISVIDNTIIGSTAAFNLGANDSITLAMQSPVSTFSSIAANNQNSESHLVFLTVNQNTSITLNNLSLFDTGAHTFNFLAGDVIALGEDLFHSCFNAPGIGGVCGDRDYNDLIVRIRQVPNAAVPEPATVLLSSLGMGALLRRRRSPK